MDIRVEDLDLANRRSRQRAVREPLTKHRAIYTGGTGRHTGEIGDHETDHEIG